MFKLKTIVACIASALIASASMVLADYAVTQGSGTTVFAFTCFTTKVCPATVPVDSAGGDMTDTTNHALKVVGIGLADGSTSAGQTFSKVGANVTTAAPSYTTAQTNPLSMTTAGGLRVDVASNGGAALDPCLAVVPTYTPISITSATTTRIIAPTAAKKTYICQMFLLSAIANNIAVIEGTGGTCGAATAGIIGGTTAANGVNLAANSGFAIGQGSSAVAATAGSNVDFCLITSAAGPLAGTVKWVQQ